jgi:steroid 5-alpha reductase family enzyme
MNMLETLLAGWLAAALLMGGLWLVQRARGNAAIVDVGWTFATTVLGAAFALGADGHLTRRVVIVACVFVWGTRLGVHLWRRVRLEPEDGRYEAMRSRWATATQRNLLGFFQIQAFWAVLFAAPILAAAANPQALGPFDALGIILWLLSMMGEAIADAQLVAFKAEPSNRGKVCRSGLWRYSRHPNYFFEWLHWWAYAAFAVGSPLWWVAVGGVVAMFLFLTRVTGIPPTEVQALRSRGDAYREYQRTTNAFFPWAPKEGR